MSFTMEHAFHLRMNPGPDSCFMQLWSSPRRIRFWNDFRGLNNYITRVQSFLQQGMADNDILLYFPVFDRYSDYGRGMLEHFDAISPAFNGTPFKTAAEK